MALGKCTVLAAIALVAGAFETPSLAQNAAAEALFSDGERLLKEGKVAEACDAFEGSNRIAARAGTLINLGLCREQNGQLASAWSAFKDALTRVKDPKKQKIASDHVAAIEPKLSYLTISVPDESRIDGLVVSRNTVPVDAALWNRAIPLDGGTYVIAGRAPGHEEWSTTVVVQKESAKVTVDVPKFKELGKLVPTPEQVAQQPKPEEDVVETRPESAPSMFTSKRKVAVGIGAVGVLAVGGGVLLGLQAKGYEDDAFALCPNPANACPDSDRANALIDKADSRAMLANVSFGVGAAALIGAGVLWFLGVPATPEAGVAVIPHGGKDSASLDLTVRF
jgi:hypothetical protein